MGKSYGHEHWQSHFDETIQPQIHIEILIYDFIKNVNNVSFDFVNILNIFDNVKHHLTQLITVKGGSNPLF